MTLPEISKLTCFQVRQRISGSVRRNYTRITSLRSCPSGTALMTRYGLKS